MNIKKGVKDSHVYFYAVWDGIGFNTVDVVRIQDESGWYKNWKYFLISRKVNHKKLETGLTYFVGVNINTFEIDKVFKDI